MASHPIKKKKPVKKLTTKKKPKKRRASLTENKAEDQVEKLMSATGEYDRRPGIPGYHMENSIPEPDIPVPDVRNIQQEMEVLKQGLASILQSIQPPLQSGQQLPGEDFTRGLVMLHGKDPSLSTKPQPLASDGHKGEHRSVEMMGKGKPKYVSPGHATLIQDFVEDAVDTLGNEVPTRDVSHLATPHTVASLGNQPKRLKVTLTIEVCARKVGAGNIIHLERVQEPSFWNSLLSRTGKLTYGDPQVECKGVQLSDLDMETLLS